MHGPQGIRRLSGVTVIRGQIPEALAQDRKIEADGPLRPSLLARRSLASIAGCDLLGALIDAAEAIASNRNNPWSYAA